MMLVTKCGAFPWFYASNEQWAWQIADKFTCTFKSLALPDIWVSRQLLQLQTMPNMFVLNMLKSWRNFVKLGECPDFLYKRNFELMSSLKPIKPCIISQYLQTLKYYTTYKITLKINLSITFSSFLLSVANSGPGLPDLDRPLPGIRYKIIYKCV